MLKIPLFEVKNKLSFFVDLVEQGECVEITRHGRTSALLVKTENMNAEKKKFENSPFYIAYMSFRKNIEESSLSEEEWKSAFEIERKSSEMRPSSDFE